MPGAVQRVPYRLRAGQVINLSLQGCCLRTQDAVKPGHALQVQLQASTGEPPIQINRAMVQWALAPYVGVEFLTLSQDNQQRIQQVIRELEQQPVQPI